MKSKTCLKCGRTWRQRANGCLVKWAYHQWTPKPARSEETIVIQRLTVTVMPEDTRLDCSICENQEDFNGACKRKATAGVRYETWQNGVLSATTRHFCFAHIPRRAANALRRDGKMPQATVENGGIYSSGRSAIGF